MVKKKKIDRFGVIILSIQVLIFIMIAVIAVMNLDSKDLLVEFRYNFIKFFVDKVEWYWRLFPAIASLLFLSANIYLWRLELKIIKKATLNLYLSLSIIPQIFLLVITLSMQAAF
ncbi:hypothetical protein KBB17_00470 [Candidatus Saccharibacteria bacterium]|jgi:hypothetical protein|nr:hypothetical protein [Candidatus Saccharibacteria bacterium]MBP9131525.1 hypothetical protein [Candidatus Saccharibacteria bacterium]